VKRKYGVVLPVDIDGRIYEFGSELELDDETAGEYSHALIAVEEEGK